MQGLNMRITPEKAYHLTILNLKSRSLRRRFFDEHGLANRIGSGGDVELVFEKNFNQALKVDQEKKHKEFVTVSFEGDNAELAAQWVNGFLALVQKETVNALMGDMQDRIKNAKRELRAAIAAKRKLAKQRRLDRIAELEEAIQIAKNMGLEENPLITDSKGAKAITMNQLPLYMMGTKALQAELNALRHRRDDDPFIEGLRNLQEQLAKLERLEFDPKNIRSFRLDQKAIPPKRPFKPKRMLVVALSLIAGLALGMFAAFFAEAFAKAKEERKGITSCPT